MPDLPGAIECVLCGTRKEAPTWTLRELHATARQMGMTGKLTRDRTAIAAICPTCHSGACPKCGQPGSEHGTRHGKVKDCESGDDHA